MPKPLSDGQVEYPKAPDGQPQVPETVEQYARDVTAFLSWTAEPHLEARKRIGFQVIIFLIVLLAPALLHQEEGLGPCGRRVRGAATPPMPQSHDSGERPRMRGAFFFSRDASRAGFRPRRSIPVADDTLGASPASPITSSRHLRPERQGGLARCRARPRRCGRSRSCSAPPEALHVTIYALVPVRGRFDREAYWSAIADKAAALLRAACAEASPFALRFHRLSASDAAVIALAEDPTGQIARLRAAIAAALPPPPGLSHPRYDIVHSSLARHANARPVPAQALARLGAHPVDFAAPVERLKIVRETRYPCLALEEVASFPLG